MNICLIVWSQRDESQSLKVAQYLETLLHDQWVATSMIVLAEHGLPWYDNEHNPDVTPELRKPYAEKLSKADGLIVITPEWWGMVPGELKNLFLRCKAGEIAHKPALITAVSAGTGGAYPVAELRMSSYKNTKICYMPDHLIIRHVNNVLNHEIAWEDDIRIRARIEKTVAVLLSYTRAFKAIREDTAIDENPMPQGM